MVGGKLYGGEEAVYGSTGWNTCSPHQRFLLSDCLGGFRTHKRSTQRLTFGGLQSSNNNASQCTVVRKMHLKRFEQVIKWNHFEKKRRDTAHIYAEYSFSNEGFPTDVVT